VRFHSPIDARPLALAAALLPWLGGASEAQSFFQWAEELFGGQPSRRYERPARPTEPLRRKKEPSRKEVAPAAATEDGGPRPDIKPQAPPIVNFPYSFPSASVVIDTSGRKLYYVLEAGRAYAYSVFFRKDYAMDKHIFVSPTVNVLKVVTALRAKLALDVDAIMSLDFGAKLKRDQVKRLFVHGAIFDRVDRSVFSARPSLKAALEHSDDG